jgi:hypothetical protein
MTPLVFEINWNSALLDALAWESVAAPTPLRRRRP